MKKIFLILILSPFISLTQSDNNNFFEKENPNQKKIENLVDKYIKILKAIGGVQGWRLQIKFTSKREHILPYQKKFTKMYPNIPVQITFDSPYYKLTAGNFRTKNEALKIQHEISRHFPGSHPIAIVIDSELLQK